MEAGNEHVKWDWNDVLLAPNGPRKIVGKTEYNYTAEETARLGR